MFEWISTGGCESCDAMEGFYDEEPARPHPYCQCEIVYHERETTNMIITEQQDYEWNLERRWFENGVRHRKGVLTIRGEVRVRCWDGEELSEEVTLDLDLLLVGDQTSFPIEDVDWDDQWEEKALEMGEQLAAQCRDFLCC